MGTALGIFAVALLLLLGLPVLYDLSQGFIRGSDGQEWLMTVGTRFVSYSLIASLVYILHRNTKQDTLIEGVGRENLRMSSDVVIHVTGLTVASCELINLMNETHVPDATKLGLSILWGVYALLLIVLGIRGAKKYLRIAAICVLGVTLLKLFVYDVSDLPTIPKTILFISLGLLMLIVSFLYNRYKGAIFGFETQKE